MEYIINMEIINEFKEYLKINEKSKATIDKYLRDVIAFYKTIINQKLTKETVLAYKKVICENYAAISVNSMLAAVNKFLDFIGASELKVKRLKIQRNMFINEQKELTKQEYYRLIKAAQLQSNKRLNLILQTICSTGIRISELKYITKEAINNGRAEINCKGKLRVIFLPKELCKKLKQYSVSKNIKTGSVFITKNGNELDRSNIWRDMKKLCEYAKVAPEKVFPHNLRHLFARMFYAIEQDIVKLADIFGHSSINTTRIYTASSGREHQEKIEKLSYALLL